MVSMFLAQHSEFLFLNYQSHLFREFLLQFLICELKYLLVLSLYEQFSSYAHNVNQLVCLQNNSSLHPLKSRYFDYLILFLKNLPLMQIL
jgi:hypothetical protein